MNLSTLLGWIKPTKETLEKIPNKKDAKFKDLAPTSSAENTDAYFEALDFALSNPNVLNIGLTAPYGGGKSSVIRTYLENREHIKALNISLASFVAEAPTDAQNEDGNQSSFKRIEVSKQEIERSILQQLIYGPDASKLTFSRLKRIQTPKIAPGLVSIGFILGGLSFLYLFLNLTKLSDGSLFFPFDLTGKFNAAVFGVSLVFLWSILKSLYIKSHGFTLKGVSLRDIEITPESANDPSILNKHLDEIIYFFQATETELVIIEDLDRFQEPDIFVTLREINNLINANQIVAQTVRFIYAVRDNMFANTDRTKFFEFIIPIVPIINSSNSIDKVLEQGQRLSVIDRLDRSFLREVSRYLSDLRLIHNIFNEYAVYEANLETEEHSQLDPNKLLAILIYKNINPVDFENLHKQQGIFRSLLDRQDELRRTEIQTIESQIEAIDSEIQDSKKEIVTNIKNLNRIYAMAIIESLPEQHDVIVMGPERIPLRQLSSSDKLPKLLKTEQVSSQRTGYGAQGSLKPREIQSSVNSNLTYEARRAIIEKTPALFQREKAIEQVQLRRSINDL